MSTVVSYTQANRPIRVDTPLGEDVLLLNGLNGLEGISQLFAFQLELLSTKPDIDMAGLLGQPIVVTLNLPAGEQRKIHGHVSRLTQLGRRDDLVFYRAEVVPWLWFLTLTRESRIYQELPVPDILEQVFKRQGFSDFEFLLTREYAPRTYCVQYRETHFNFVSRLMEEEGIFYFFKHEGDKHTLVLADNPGSSEPCPAAATASYVVDRAQEEGISEFEHEYSFQPGKVTLTDYCFETPDLKLDATLGEAVEIYDHPGGYSDRDTGERLARLLLEAEECERHVVHGESSVHGLIPGYHFTLEEHYRRDLNAKYLVTQVQHLAQAGQYRAWSEAGEIDYTNAFACIPAEVPYRPPRITPRPIVHGAQTAVVVGPAGEEVYVDKYGRIKVQFHWDRDGKRDENSSCWVRVATPWGGKGWGSVTLPRIGCEVVIAFEHGDPDRPYVIGSVYNADQMPPFELPGAGIQMGMKSRSSPGGGGSNEFNMLDTKDKEMVFLHAQKDMTVIVENDQNVTVNNGNRAMTIKSGTLSDTVKGDSSLTIQAGSRTVSVTGGDYSATASAAVVLHGKGAGVAITGDAKGVGITGNGEGVAITGNGKGVGIEGNGEGVGIKGNGKGVGIEGNGEGVGIVGNGAGVGIKGDPDFFAEGTSTAGIKAPVVDIGDSEINIVGTKITIAAGASTIVLDAGGVSISGPLVKIN